MTRMYARTLATAGAAVIVTICSSMTADAQDRVRWKMQSAFGSNLSHLGTSGVRFTENMERVSDGSFRIEFYEPGALVPAAGAELWSTRVRRAG